MKPKSFKRRCHKISEKKTRKDINIFGARQKCLIPWGTIAKAGPRSYNRREGGRGQSRSGWKGSTFMVAGPRSEDLTRSEGEWVSI